MTALWDTTLASRLHPDSEVLDYVLDQVADGTPVRVAATAILEIAYGYQRMAAGDTRYDQPPKRISESVLPLRMLSAMR